MEVWLLLFSVLFVLFAASASVTDLVLFANPSNAVSITLRLLRLFMPSNILFTPGSLAYCIFSRSLKYLVAAIVLNSQFRNVGKHSTTDRLARFHFRES